MCFELTNKLTDAQTVTAAELETLLADLDVDVLADTIEQDWTPLDRYVVLDWIGGMLAARKLDDNSLVPNMPEVLVPFYDASRLQEAI
ncbi:MAG: hypothetical protein Q7U44_00465 [Desulfuromonadales bacterium]|nr:hypothetical protein [Desulfuromonadales bacterium]